MPLLLWSTLLEPPPLLVCLLLRSVNKDEYPPAGQTRGGDSLWEEGDHGSQSFRHAASRRKGVRIFDRRHESGIRDHGRLFQRESPLRCVPETYRRAMG